MKNLIRIATRKSPLALWQANHVKECLQSHFPTVKIELEGILTAADRMPTMPLDKFGGKGIFVKELEQAILENRADLAVHSIKDMPMQLPAGLQLAAVLKREDPRDVFISNQYPCLGNLPEGAKVGTSSLRRKAQILLLQPHLNVLFLRGNVGTRLKKLDDNEYDGIILAAAGLIRLGKKDRIQSYFSAKEIVPAAGQGAIGIECRAQDMDLLERIAKLNDPTSAYCVAAERMLSEQLGGGCQFPIAAFATVEDNLLTLNALVSDPKGSKVLRTCQEGPLQQALNIGLLAAQHLKAQGAERLLAQIRQGL